MGRRPQFSTGESSCGDLVALLRDDVASLLNMSMHETRNDLRDLQDLLDWSQDSAGPHLREVLSPERWLAAEDVCNRLTGISLLSLATVTSDGRPLVGPVDGTFFRGAFHFGSSHDSVRIQHIRRRPSVSATHLPGEEFAVTVHGEASVLDMRSNENADLRSTVLNIYVPKYGAEWEAFFDSNVYVRIVPKRMFTLHLA
jgi:general stress protein 26